MSNKRNPGKNGSLQRNLEKAERREWGAYHRSYGSKKRRIQQKAWRAFAKVNEARRAYIDNCYFGDNV